MRPIKRFFSQTFKTVFPRIKLNEFESDPNVFMGQTVLARPELDAPDEEVEIKQVKGCVAPHLQKYFEINGTHFCHMFSFYTQMMEKRVPSQDEMDEFELASQIKDIKTMGDNVGKSKRT